MTPIRLLLIEDEPELALVIERFLTESVYSVDVAPDAKTAVETLASNHYDVLILDLGLPDQDGFDLLKRIKQENDDVPVLILSGRTSLHDRLKGLHEGADDYLTKPFALAELNVRLKKLARRRCSSDSATKLTAFDLELDLIRREVTRAGHTIPLTSQEFRTLELMVANAGKVVSRKTILEQVWGLPLDPQSNVLDIRMSRLRAKIDAFGEKRLIHTVRGLGFVLRDG